MAVIRSEYFSQAMCRFRSFSAVLPIDLPPAEGTPRSYAPGPWPTLYLLHGYAGSRNDWLRNSPVEMLAAKYGIAVIMPDGGNSFYLDNPVTGERAGEMIGRELVVMIEGKVADEDTYVARTYRDAPNVDGYLFLNSTASLMTGDLVKVMVTDANEYDLIGEAYYD